MSTANVSAEQLRLFVERLERLAEEVQAAQDDFRDVLAEAKANGYDVKTLRSILKLRKMDATLRAESAALLETYCSALNLDPGFTGFGDGPAEDPRQRAIEDAILAALRSVGRVNIVRLKAAVKDKAAKALSYDDLTARLGALIDRGEAHSDAGRDADFPEYWAA